ncbi:hypothetical protein [Rufibacter sp. XAAS-G3-1]|uniref:hypothetical protein n=1 Tax=Rufibacter sp. XAAS-G3-1 TaxID=2729134 RepID=UPI0015E6E395|nr:hypothetical protein [Rufibacter sp. XAAS-G3-1]
MGQLGFIFFAAVGFWVGMSGVVEANQLVNALVPMLAEIGPSLVETEGQAWQTACLRLVTAKLFP